MAWARAARAARAWSCLFGMFIFIDIDQAWTLVSSALPSNGKKTREVAAANGGRSRPGAGPSCASPSPAAQ